MVKKDFKISKSQAFVSLKVSCFASYRNEGFVKTKIKHKMTDTKFENYDDEFFKFIEESIQKSERKKRFSEMGKLGGRPKKSQKKIYKYLLSLNERQNELAKDLAEKNGISLQEFLRRKIENEPLPNPERNKLLIKTYSNFTRIGNFFESKIWTENERTEFKSFLSYTCNEILKSIKI